MTTKNEPAAQSKGQQLLRAAVEAAWATEPDATNKRNLDIFAIVAATLLDSALQHIEKMRAHAAELEARVQEPLTDAQIKSGRLALAFESEDSPEPWAFREGVRFAEEHHGITAAQQGDKQ